MFNFLFNLSSRLHRRIKTIHIVCFLCRHRKRLPSKKKREFWLYKKCVFVSKIHHVHDFKKTNLDNNELIWTIHFRGRFLKCQKLNRANNDGGHWGTWVGLGSEMRYKADKNELKMTLIFALTASLWCVILYTHINSLHLV